MEISDFIKTLEPEFEEVPPGTLSGETEFRKMEGWSSMMALILIAKIDSDYNIMITAEELAKCSTLNDLFSMVNAKVA